MIETGSWVDRTEVASRILRAFAVVYPNGIEPFDSALKEIHDRSGLVGCDVTVGQSGHQLRGRVLGFGPNGELRLRSPDGSERTLASGELVRVQEENRDT